MEHSLQQIKWQQQPSLSSMSSTSVPYYENVQQTSNIPTKYIYIYCSINKTIISGIV